MEIEITLNTAVNELRALIFTAIAERMRLGMGKKEERVMVLVELQYLLRQLGAAFMKTDITFRAKVSRTRNN